MVLLAQAEALRISTRNALCRYTQHCTACILVAAVVAVVVVVAGRLGLIRSLEGGGVVRLSDFFSNKPYWRSSTSQHC
jgi:hypothetical protein